MAVPVSLLIVADVFSLRHYWGVWDRHSQRTMIPGAVIGIAFGAAFFGFFSDNERILKVGLGVISLAFVAFQAFRTLILGRLAEMRPADAAGVGGRIHFGGGKDRDGT